MSCNVETWIKYGVIIALFYQYTSFRRYIYIAAMAAPTRCTMQSLLFCWWLYHKLKRVRAADLQTLSMLLCLVWKSWLCCNWSLSRTLKHLCERFLPGTKVFLVTGDYMQLLMVGDWARHACLQQDGVALLQDVRILSDCTNAPHRLLWHMQK
jgi:hypothetical protein